MFRRWARRDNRRLHSRNRHGRLRLNDGRRFGGWPDRRRAGDDAADAHGAGAFGNFQFANAGGFD
jgi:hypothetical protein